MADNRFEARLDTLRRSAPRARSIATRPRRRKAARRRPGALRLLADGVGFVALGLLAAFAFLNLSPSASALLPAAVAEVRPMATVAPAEGIQARRIAASQHFTVCGAGQRINCVVDGDTFYFRGEKIRVADINTPEVSQPKCAAEARLAAEATRRFRSLLNAGSIELRRGARDEDRYGRKLRTVHRDGRSLGDAMVAEGLAHPWRGHKEDWCA